MLATNLIEATSDMGAFVLFSGLLKSVAVKLSKICNDLRLLSTGPRAGLGEINLPAMQPGSSIMPGKVNPVIPEVVNQVAFRVIGNDLTVTLAAEGGQLQLNAFEPTIAFCILQSMRRLTAALDTLTVRCIGGITADRERCRALAQQHRHRHRAQPVLGYEVCSRVAKTALETGRGVVEIVLEEGLLSEEQVATLAEAGEHDPAWPGADALAGRGTTLSKRKQAMHSILRRLTRPMLAGAALFLTISRRDRTCRSSARRDRRHRRHHRRRADQPARARLHGRRLRRRR